MDAATRRSNLQALIRSRYGDQQAAAAAALQLSPGRVSQLLDEAQAFGERAARRIEQSAGLPPMWLDRPIAANRADDWTPPQHTPEGVSVRPVAQDLSHPKFEDAPIAVAWERILIDPLKPEFQTTMPDASMEPDIPRGARIIFITGEQAEPGDFVLIRDRENNPFVRELRQLKPGRWEAHALNPAFLPMDSERDGLEVLAVFDGIRGRRARR